MKSVIAILVLATAVFAKVIDLTNDNFDSVVDGSQGAFVEFFAPWCGHCKKLAPDYEIVGEAFDKIPGVVIAKVDADEHKELGGRFGVQGFPTLKWFPKGDPKNPVNYEGGRAPEDIIGFINQKAGTNAKVKKAPSDVVELTDSNFDSIVKNSDKSVLVEFFAPWCGHCKNLAPTWEKLGSAYKNEPGVVVAKIDADKHREIGGRYDVQGFPTIKFFPKGSKDAPENYEGGRELNDLVSFINQKTGTKRTADGKLDSSAGKVAALDAIAKSFTSSSDKDAEIAKAEGVAKGLTGDDATSAKVYLKLFSTIKEKGTDFVAAETQRLDKLLQGSVAANKADEFVKRKNILASFTN